MNCRRCGNALPPNALGCPRCEAAERPPAKTKRLGDTDLNKTRALVQLERCQNCGFMVFPSSTECTSCGAWIDRSWQKPAEQTGARQAAPKKRVLAGVGISFLVFILSLLVWQFLLKSPLH